MSHNLIDRLLDLSPRKVSRFVNSRVVARMARRMSDRPVPLLSPEFSRRQDRLIEKLLVKIAAGTPVEKALVDFDAKEFGERVVEYPYFVTWLLERRVDADLLDVGCVLNQGLLASILPQRIRSIWFCNPVLEPLAVDTVPVYYHAEPLQRAFRDGRQFPLVTCLSTLEHIGYDNSHYGSTQAARFDEPSIVPFVESFEQLARLVLPGGSLLVSFPFGSREVLVHPATAKISSQVMDNAALEQCLPTLHNAGIRTQVEAFAADARGWHRIEIEDDNYWYADGCPGAAAVVFVRGEKAE